MPKNILVGQRFVIGNKVYRKNIFGTTKGKSKRIGTIYGVSTKKNIKGSVYFYYSVEWDDNKRSEHAQHSLAIINSWQRVHPILIFKL